MRNTAPCLLFAALKIQQRNPNAYIVVLPSDHFVADLPLFKKDILTALSYVSTNDEILTVGIEPSSPHTGFGYLQVKEKDQSPTTISAFSEKPTLTKAFEFLDPGN